VITNNRKHSNRIKNRFSQLYRWNNNSKECRVTPVKWTINYVRRTSNWTSKNRNDKCSRERKIKTTKIYTGSHFHKGYVQSFAN